MTTTDTLRAAILAETIATRAAVADRLAEYPMTGVVMDGPRVVLTIPTPVAADGYGAEFPDYYAAAAVARGYTFAAAPGVAFFGYCFDARGMVFAIDALDFARHYDI